MSSKQTYPKFNIYIYIYIKENYMTLGQKKKKASSYTQSACDEEASLYYI